MPLIGINDLVGFQARTNPRCQVLDLIMKAKVALSLARSSSQRMPTLPTTQAVAFKELTYRRHLTKSWSLCKKHHPYDKLNLKVFNNRKPSGKLDEVSALWVLVTGDSRLSKILPRNIVQRTAITNKFCHTSPCSIRIQTQAFNSLRHRS